MTDMMDIFLVAPPGLEPVLAQEARALNFAAIRAERGGVSFRGDWSEVWRANLCLRGATRVLARIGSFRALHLAQLDKRARKFGWGDVIAPGQALRVETTCRKSRIYHAGAATQRIERALREEAGAVINPEAALCLKARIDDDLCTFSIDTTGESLHKRGYKDATGKAPMRETLAALFLRAAGYDGDVPVLDPMCGSGTFVIEAAEMAQGVWPGRARGFAFETLPSFDATAFAAMKHSAPRPVAPIFHGRDRDAGAIRGATANAERAGVADLCDFDCAPVSALTRPEGPAGLVIVNPPYGARIGNKKALYALHHSLGEVLRDRFGGWRVALVTTEGGLARATGLPFLPPGPPVPHGGLKVRLYQTAALT